MSEAINYSNLTSGTLEVESNSSYLYHTKDVPIVTDSISSSTVSLMMFMSILQYQAPYMGPKYSEAASKAGQAAFIESGGKALQDKIGNMVINKGKEITKSVGITDGEIAVLLGTYKIAKERQIDVNGPKIYSIKTHFTCGIGSGNIGLRYEW